MTGIGAAGTIWQASKKGDDIKVKEGKFGTNLRGRPRVSSRKDKSKTADIAREKDLDLTDPRQRRKAASLANKRYKPNKTNKKINPKTGEPVKPRYPDQDVIENIRKEEVAIANNASSGNIAGLPPDDPPVKRKKPPMLKRKTYATGGKKSRKPWLDYLKINKLEVKILSRG